jgi:hypothetical protein
MATPRDWADGYLAQARADLEGARLVDAAVPSVFAMLLQMAFEKFAKAALLRSGAVDVGWATSTHRAASAMLRALRLQRGLMAPIGGPLVWSDVLWAVETLEQVHPALVESGPQLEYPWELPDGRIGWPSRDLAIARSLGNPKSNLGTRILQFASVLAERFDRIFP